MGVVRVPRSLALPSFGLESTGISDEAFSTQLAELLMAMDTDDGPNALDASLEDEVMDEGSLLEKGAAEHHHQQQQHPLLVCQSPVQQEMPKQPEPTRSRFRKKRGRSAKVIPPKHANWKKTLLPPSKRRFVHQPPSPPCVDTYAHSTPYAILKLQRDARINVSITTPELAELAAAVNTVREQLGSPAHTVYVVPDFTPAIFKLAARLEAPIYLGPASPPVGLACHSFWVPSYKSTTFPCHNLCGNLLPSSGVLL